MEKVHDGSVYQFLGPLPEAASFDVLVSHAVEQHIGAVNGVVHIVDRALPKRPYLEILISTLPPTRVGFLLSAIRHGQFWLPSHRGWDSLRTNRRCVYRSRAHSATTVAVSNSCGAFLSRTNSIL